MMLISTVQ